MSAIAQTCFHGVVSVMPAPRRTRTVNSASWSSRKSNNFSVQARIYRNQVPDRCAKPYPHKPGSLRLVPAIT